MAKIDLVELKFTTEAQARAFCEEGTHASARILIDLEEDEILGWFDDPGAVVCEIAFPVGLSVTADAEKAAAEKVGAEFKVRRTELANP